MSTFFSGTFWVHFLIKFITRFLSNLNRGLSNREIDFNFLYDRRKLFMDSFKLSLFIREISIAFMLVGK